MLDPRERPLAAGAAAAGTAAMLFSLWRRHSLPPPAAAHSATSFDSYLKDPAIGSQPPQPTQHQQVDSTSFEAYLRQPAAAATPAQKANNAAAATADADPPADAAASADAIPITVLFGTEYGFSKEVAEKACEALRSAPAPTNGSSGYWPRLLDMADLPGGLPAPLAAHQALLLVCSTQGDGVPPTEARPFCDWLGGSGAPQLGGALHFSVCALGDTSYQHFCRCGRSLDARLEALGGARLAPRVDVNREDWKAIDSWVQSVLAGLATLPLKTVAELGGLAEAAVEGMGSAGGNVKRWSKGRPYMGRVAALEGLCTLGSADDKNTMRVEVDLGDSGLSYAPGDALGVWPTNCPLAVEELLGTLGVEGGLLVQVPGWHYADPLLPAGTTSMPLRDALSRCCDLRQPKPELLRLLHAKLTTAGAAANGGTNGANGAAVAAAAQMAGKGGIGGGKPGKGRGKGRVQHTRNADSASELNMSADSMHKEGGVASSGVLSVSVNASGAGVALTGHDTLCAGGCLADRLERLAALRADSAAADAYLAPRHVIDVLRDFLAPAGAAPLAPAELLGTLRQLQPRLYSISSSQLEDPHRVQVTVAVVRYSSLGADRLGVCSTFLAERLQEGQTLPVYIHSNPDFRLPADEATPIVMVGPGTGLAPFRSFMQERILRAQQAGTALGPCVLYFGCRRRDQDYLYGPMLEGWAAEGKLQLHTAFSREQAGKVYVQDRLAQSGRQVWDLLHRQGGHFYVCGDAGSMAGAVEKALLKIIEEGQGQGPEAAAAFLQALSDAGRYQRDVWLS